MRHVPGHTHVSDAPAALDTQVRHDLGYLSIGKSNPYAQQAAFKLQEGYGACEGSELGRAWQTQVHQTIVGLQRRRA